MLLDRRFERDSLVVLLVLDLELDQSILLSCDSFSYFLEILIFDPGVRSAILVQTRIFPIAF